MNQDKQPEAQRLADDLMTAHNGHSDEGPSTFSEAASELRRQHARIAELEAELVKEAARTADYKLRAEQFEQRLDMANKLGNTAREELAALKAAPAAPAAELQRMTAGRASYFMERFLREEKLLGPNEQAALHFVINMLTAPAPQAVEPVKANCYSDDNGDYWRDRPDDCDLVEGLKVGDTYELQASIRAWSETFRVTKAPDEESDDYEVELVSSDTPTFSAPQAQDVQRDDGPSWMKLYYAWRKVGADLKGLHWGAFTHAVHYAPEDITAAHAEIDAAIAASAKGGE